MPALRSEIEIIACPSERADSITAIENLFAEELWDIDPIGRRAYSSDALYLGQFTEDNVAIGAAIVDLKPAWPPQLTDSDALLARLLVARDYREQGIGESLLSTAEAAAAEHGKEALWLVSLFSKLAFYEKRDYSVVKDTYMRKLLAVAGLSQS